MRGHQGHHSEMLNPAAAEQIFLQRHSLLFERFVYRSFSSHQFLFASQQMRRERQTDSSSPFTCPPMFQGTNLLGFAPRLFQEGLLFEDLLQGNSSAVWAAWMCSA